MRRARRGSTVEVGAGVRSGARVALVMAQQGDLGPHHRPVGDVVVAQPGRRRVGRELGVAIEEGLGGAGVAEVFEVHGQERRVVEPVDVPEVVVEVQAVQEAGSVVEAVDVVGEQVAVAVDDPIGALCQQGCAAVEELQDQRLERGRQVGVDHSAHVRREFADVGQPAQAQRFGPSTDDHCGIPPRAGVEGRQGAGDRAKCRFDVVPVRHQRRQPAGGGHPSHDDDGLGLRTGALGPVEREEPADPEVHVGRQPPVEFDLAFAGRRPAGGCGEVEEVRAHGLLELVGAVADEEHHPGVRLVRHHRCVRELIDHSTDDRPGGDPGGRADRPRSLGRSASVKGRTTARPVMRPSRRAA
jgi:hypothetical protein